jgi:hypothetical protein
MEEFQNDLKEFQTAVDTLKHLSEVSLSLAQTFLHHENINYQKSDDLILNNCCDSLLVCSKGKNMMCFIPEKVKIFDFFCRIKEYYEKTSPSVVLNWNINCSRKQGEENYTYPDLLAVVMNSIIYHVISIGSSQVSIEACNSFHESSSLLYETGERPTDVISVKEPQQINLTVKIKVTQLLPQSMSYSINDFDIDNGSDIITNEYEMLDAKTLNNLLQSVNASYRIKAQMLSNDDFETTDATTQVIRRCNIEHLIKLPTFLSLI